MLSHRRLPLLTSALGIVGALVACMPPPEAIKEHTRAPTLAASSPVASAPAPKSDEAPQPAPAPSPSPPSAEEITQILDAGASALRERKVRRSPTTPSPRGLPDDLRLAYTQGRALGYSGNVQQVRDWMATAKFADRGRSHEPGPLARYDLVVTTSNRGAWLHVVVPAEGLAPTGQTGTHYRTIRDKQTRQDERWVALSDHLVPGTEYLPFKRSARASLSRQWGEQGVIESLRDMAIAYHARTGILIGIGDISEVTGGKISDHWTHRQGVDADLYLLHFEDQGVRCVWHTLRRGASIWSLDAEGRRGIEVPEREGEETPSAQRLRVLAELALEDDAIAYFVHNDPEVLDTFDLRASERRPGRRFLHAKNRAFWPAHRDHIHLRWVDGPLPVGVQPRP